VGVYLMLSNWLLMVGLECVYALCFVLFRVLGFFVFLFCYFVVVIVVSFR